MAEYIEREVVLSTLMNDGCTANNIDAVMNIPATDVVKVRHEKWIPCKNQSGYKCSGCGARIKNAAFFNGNHIWCHKCGAKMGGGKDGNT